MIPRRPAVCINPKQQNNKNPKVLTPFDFLVNEVLNDKIISESGEERRGKGDSPPMEPRTVTARP